MNASKCPICSRRFSIHSINSHVNKCIEEASNPKTPTKPSQDAVKKPYDIFTPSPRPTAKRTSPALPTSARKKRKTTSSLPLAERLRPQQYQNIVGQQHILGSSQILRMLLETDQVPNMILWGPPGCGKTTLARSISATSSRKFLSYSATTSNIADLRTLLQKHQSGQTLGVETQPPILFIDEIHRFSKTQQDVFLPFVEAGTVRLIGATTENPSFQLTSALLSRCRVYPLQKLTTDALITILKTAIDDQERGIRMTLPADTVGMTYDDKVLEHIAGIANGDARIALNTFECAVQAAIAKDPKKVHISKENVLQGFERSHHVIYDRAADAHYDFISALHKSIRGSDANAGLYWLGRMLQGGEDPMYIARRLIRIASEDIGLADPLALNQAVSTSHACHAIGMPECDVVLAQCVVYLARAPKSIEVYRAWKAVKQQIATHKGLTPEVPMHLRNAPTQVMKELGYNKGYIYNPDHPGPVDQTYLPDELVRVDFFTPSSE